MGVGRVSAIRLVRIVAKATSTPWDVVMDKIRWNTFLGILADIGRENREQEAAMKSEQAKISSKMHRG